MRLLAKEETVSTELITRITNNLEQLSEEREEFLQTINENTQEIQEVYAYAAATETKVAKLQEQIEEMKLIISKMTGKKIKKVPAFEDIDPLTTMEKSVFQLLYVQDTPIAFSDLSAKLKLSVGLTRQYVLNLMEKGIPINKTYHETRPLVMLDRRFRNIQAKKNILKIEQKILV